MEEILGLDANSIVGKFETKSPAVREWDETTTEGTEDMFFFFLKCVWECGMGMSVF